MASSGAALWSLFVDYCLVLDQLWCIKGFEGLCDVEEWIIVHLEIIEVGILSWCCFALSIWNCEFTRYNVLSAMAAFRFGILFIRDWDVFLCLSTSSRAASLLVTAINDRNLHLRRILTIFTWFHSYGIQIVLLSGAEDFLINLFFMWVYVGRQFALHFHRWGHQSLCTFYLTTFAGRAAHWDSRPALLEWHALTSSGLCHCWTWIILLWWLGMTPMSRCSGLLVSRFDVNTPIVWLLGVLSASSRRCQIHFVGNIVNFEDLCFESTLHIWIW